MIEPLLILCAGFMDRIRGDSFHLFSRTIEKLTYGWIIAAIAGYSFSLLTIPIAILFAVGMSPGWGKPLGAALDGKPMTDIYGKWETWQYGFTRKNAWVALTVRGVITGIPLFLTGLYAISFAIMIAFAIAFPVSAFIARSITKDDPWSLGEYFRGWIAASIIWGLV